jgi:hypothetical protein
MNVKRIIEDLEDNGLAGYFNINATIKAVEGLKNIFENKKLEAIKRLICGDFFKQSGEELNYTRLMQNEDSVLLGPIEEDCKEKFNPEFESETGLSPKDCCDLILSKINLFYKYFTDNYAPNHESNIWAPVRDECSKATEESEYSDLYILGIVVGAGLVGAAAGYLGYRYFNRTDERRADESLLENVTPGSTLDSDVSVVASEHLM